MTNFLCIGQNSHFDVGQPEGQTLGKEGQVLDVNGQVMGLNG